jgi:hypothetical protein
LRCEQNSFLTQHTLAAIRGLLVKAVLGTDMAKHAETMTRLVDERACLFGSFDLLG